MCVFVCFARVSSQRFCGRKRTLTMPPSRCWSTCEPCTASCSSQRLRGSASTRRRKRGAWPDSHPAATTHHRDQHRSDGIEESFSVCLTNLLWNVSDNVLIYMPLWVRGFNTDSSGCSRQDIEVIFGCHIIPVLTWEAGNTWLLLATAKILNTRAAKELQLVFSVFNCP